MTGPEKPTVLYTIGYDGLTVPALVRKLQEAGVERLVDVRKRPSSRQRGFSLMQMFERLRKSGIHYEHLKGLGNPDDIRALWFAGELEKGRKQYRRYLENGSSGDVDLLIGLAKLKPTAILCRENDHETCHRSVVAEVAAERDPSIEVVHL